jgi:hypothetical protein
MKTFKKTLTHIFVCLVNFYLLTFFVGLFIMLWTTFFGSINMWASSLFMLTTLTICVIYQNTRNKWNITSIGETIINSNNKNDIIDQVKVFKISRIPIFLLVFVTLALNGNLQDGISEGKTFKIGEVVFLALMFSCIYYGLKNFFTKPEMLPIYLIAGGLLVVGFGYKFSPNAPLTGQIIFYIETGLAILWMIIGYIYKNQKTERLEQY